MHSSFLLESLATSSTIRQFRRGIQNVCRLFAAVLAADLVCVFTQEANPFPDACPPADEGEDGLDASDDPTLYDTALTEQNSQRSNQLSNGNLSPSGKV